MNRRRFLELLGMAAAGTGIVYSFPSVIVPRNIALPEFAHPPRGLGFLLDDGSRIFQGITTMTEWTDFYREQILQAKDWFQLAHPLVEALNKTNSKRTVIHPFWSRA